MIRCFGRISFACGLLPRVDAAVQTQVADLSCDPLSPLTRGGGSVLCIVRKVFSCHVLRNTSTCSGSFQTSGTPIQSAPSMFSFSILAFSKVSVSFSFLNPADVFFPSLSSEPRCPPPPPSLRVPLGFEDAKSTSLLVERFRGPARFFTMIPPFL